MPLIPLSHSTGHDWEARRQPGALCPGEGSGTHAQTRRGLF